MALGDPASNISTSLFFACSVASRSASLALRPSSCSRAGNWSLVSRSNRASSSARVDTSGSGMAAGGCGSADGVAAGAEAGWLAWFLPNSTPKGLLLWAIEDGPMQSATNNKSSTRPANAKHTARGDMPELSPGRRAVEESRDMLLPHYRLCSGSRLKSLVDGRTPLLATQLIQHGLHLGERVLIASAARTFNASPQHRLRFVAAFSAGKGLGGHKISVGVVRMGCEQKLKLGERGLGLAGARILQPKRIAGKGIIGIGFENLFQHRHAAGVRHDSFSYFRSHDTGAREVPAPQREAVPRCITIGV